MIHSYPIEIVSHSLKDQNRCVTQTLIMYKFYVIKVVI